MFSLLESRCQGGDVVLIFCSWNLDGWFATALLETVFRYRAIDLELVCAESLRITSFSSSGDHGHQ